MAASLRALVILAAFLANVALGQPNGFLEGSFFRAASAGADGRTDTGGEVVPGTPPDGSRFELECNNPSSPSTPSTCSFPWPEAPPTWCAVGYHCFGVVTAMSMQPPVFSHSEELQGAVNDRSVLVAVDSSQMLQTPVGSDPIRLTIYNLQVVSFVDADDLQVCFRAGKVDERCVHYTLAREPDWVHVRTESLTEFQPELLVPGFPYQSMVIFVRAHDFNRRDAVDIKLITAPNVTTEASPTSNLVFPIEESDNNLEAASFKWVGPAACIDADATPGFCPSGIWERIGALKPKLAPLTYNATFGAYDDEEDALREAPARGVAKIRNDPSSPSFLDDISSSRAGVPTGSPLSGQFVGAEGSESLEVAGDPLTQARAYVNCPVRAALYALAGANLEASPDVTLTTPRPPGMAVASSTEALTLGGIGINRGNFGLFNEETGQGRVVTRTDVQWTPQQGQEGRRYHVCLQASLGAASTTRCFVIAVARCRYCAAAGDTLRSIASRFQTTWLQLWTANGSRQLTVEPGALMVLGPTYTTKPLDSLDSLATRFHTDVERLLLLNPDIEDPAVVPVGAEICFLPDICPV